MSTNHKYVVIALFSFIGLLYIGKLFHIQVASDKFSTLAQSRLSDSDKLPAYRGLIYDRNGEILVYNKPVFQVQFLKKDINPKNKQKVCSLLKLEAAVYDSLLKAQKQSYLPGVLVKEITPEDYAKIRDQFDFPGFQFVPKIIRAYPHESLANTLGYIGEINKRQLNADTSGYYESGDLIGLSGLEKTYEEALRGKHGIKYYMLNRKRVRSGPFNEGNWDTLSIKGKNLKTTIDLNLQKYGEQLLANKIGGIVALDPNTGGILSIVTSPSYNPNMLSGVNYARNSGLLQKDTLLPLYNRAIQSKYPPGSIFKLLQSVVGLGDSSTTLREKIYCRGGIIGDHAPPGYYDYHRAIMLSSNTYYVQLYSRMLDKEIIPGSYFKDARASYEIWYKSMSTFGLGKRLGLDIPNESSGRLPKASFYDRIHGKYRWAASTIRSNAIGQGEIELSPLQMANMAAIIANKGSYYIPHIVKTIDGKQDGLEKYYQKQETAVTNPVYYDAIADAMEDVVNRGTALRARTKGIAVCGKTGTIENKKGEDHSCFIAYAPKENPQIAIAVYVENAGYGGRWAAPIASLMIEKYLTNTISNKYKEKRVLEKRFINLPLEIVETK